MPRSRDDYDDDEPRPRRRLPDDDDDDDDRPVSRRRRTREVDEDDYDERRRKRSRERVEKEKKWAANGTVLGILSLVKGLGALLASFIPCMGIIAVFPAALGLFLGIMSLVCAKKSGGRQGRGLGIAGISVSAAAIVIAGIWMLIMHGFSREVEKAEAEARQERVERLAKVESEVKSGPAISVNAVTLDRQYDENELAADAKYKGKILEVTGVVVRVHRDKGDVITVELRGIDEDSTVDCDFKKNRENEMQLATLRPGAQIKIRGVCQGYDDDYVTLEGCMLVR